VYRNDVIRVKGMGLYVCGIILIILGLICTGINYMNFITASNIMQQQVYVIKLVVNWLVIISGILLVKL
jgi:uncharacterized membrane protein YidH (DUF202 family)